ncbi:putative cysteine-rich receptor-like protein kinase 35 [Hordeum vulgare]|nr:putative cysteine-rich receptor-like protein kinase 35 [Hordeum vulgare]
MDNDDSLVVYARVMLPEEVAYLQAKRAMHQAHGRARASPRTPSPSFLAPYSRRRPPTSMIRWRCAWRTSAPVLHHRRHQHYPCRQSPPLVQYSPISPSPTRTPRPPAPFVSRSRQREKKRGGFGPVYRGRLPDGREVAVKRLGAGSRQGAREFKNEANLLSRVQHRNVVNLLGYCAHGTDEKLLVYEYVPNESLDKILFSAAALPPAGSNKTIVRLPRHAPLPPLPRLVFPGAIVASATAATEEGGHGCGGASAATHLHRAWRLMTAAASWKEAALQVLVVTIVLPLATYPVYAFALDCGQAQGGCVLLLGSLYGYLLSSVGVQLYSAVAATVFYHWCMEQQRHELGIRVTMKAMKLGNTPINCLKLIKGAIA